MTGVAAAAWDRASRDIQQEGDYRCGGGYI